MLNGLDPILIFQFKKLLPDLLDLGTTKPKIPVVASEGVSTFPLPFIPIYLSEKLTGLYIDTENKSIEIDSQAETLSNGDAENINQRGHQLDREDRDARGSRLDRDLAALGSHRSRLPEGHVEGVLDHLPARRGDGVQRLLAFLLDRSEFHERPLQGQPRADQAVGAEAPDPDRGQGPRHDFGGTMIAEFESFDWYLIVNKTEFEPTIFPLER
jgi:hypothetical protein